MEPNWTHYDWSIYEQNFDYFLSSSWWCSCLHVAQHITAAKRGHIGLITRHSRSKVDTIWKCVCMDKRTLSNIYWGSGIVSSQRSLFNSFYIEEKVVLLAWQPKVQLIGFILQSLYVRLYGAKIMLIYMHFLMTVLQAQQCYFWGLFMHCSWGALRVFATGSLVFSFWQYFHNRFY